MGRQNTLQLCDGDMPYMFYVMQLCLLSGIITSVAFPLFHISFVKYNPTVLELKYISKFLFGYLYRF